MTLAQVAADLIARKSSLIDANALTDTGPRVVRAEEERFGETLEQGMRIFDEVAARSGDTIPGVGRVESIVRWGSRWVIATASGLIATP